MARFDKGVRWYTTGRAVLEVPFPEDAVCCRYCPYLRTEAEFARCWCRLTGELLFAPGVQRGTGCPIRFEGDVNE